MYSCLWNNLHMFGCRGCVGEEEEPCLVLDHHPGDAVDQYAGGEDQHNLFSNFYIFMFVYFCQEGPGSVEWKQGRCLRWMQNLLTRLKVNEYYYLEFLS